MKKSGPLIWDGMEGVIRKLGDQEGTKCAKCLGFVRVKEVPPFAKILVKDRWLTW